jgi:DeoR/GlpR family transcriptional regulator of sugar metabolism
MIKRKCKWSKNRRRVKAVYISNSDYIILGSGSNIHYLSRIIKGFHKLTVLTPSLKVSLELCKELSIDTIQLGGDIRNSSTSAVGPIAESILGQFLVINYF